MTSVLARSAPAAALAAALILPGLVLPAAAQAPLPAIFAAAEPGSGIYIDATYLASIIGRSDVKVIDVRSAEDYAAGHIAGAISIPNNQLNTTIDGIASELVSIAEREATFAAAGLSYSDTLVIYGSGSIGKAYIAFDQSGFENVHILNDGISAWTAPLSTQAVIPTPSDFVLDRAKIEIVSKEYVLARLGDPDVFILDARQNVEDFNAGFIPGSIHIPRGVYFDGDALRPLDELIAYLSEIGVTPESEIITTCGAGPSASDLLTVLRNLGYTNIVLYDGSWNEWSQDPETPKDRIQG